ncbi:MAG: EAL domain-containing protein [Acidimicrobiales bacterium]|nr:EAL domain-containing protein [Acidimicrobiales bacterium]
MSALIVEGVPGIRRILRGQLRDRGMDVTTAGSVSEAREAIGRRSFPVVIVDLVLPDGSGLDVLDTLRGSGSAAHVIITSDSPADADRVAALEHGADDYVVKPLLLRQLAARVLAVRRIVDPANDARLHIGTVLVDLRAREARVDDRLLDLTDKEFDLLAYLAARPGHTFSKAHLLRAVWGADADLPARTVADHIRQLRTKIEDDASRPRILRTVRGSGYRLEQPDPDHPDGGAGSGPVAGSIVHVQGRIVKADQAAASLLGFDVAGELVGRQIFEFATPTEMEPARLRMAETEPSPRPRTQLIDLEHTDGTQVSVEVASEPCLWRGSSGERLRFTHVPDVSARLRRLVTGVLSEVTDAVIITDLHFHVRSWNTAAERLYGWREEEVLGRHMLDVLQWGDDAQGVAATWEDLEISERWRGQSQHITRDGSVIGVLATTTLLRDDDGGPVLIVSVNRPVPDAVTSRQVQDALDDEEIRLGLQNDEFEVYFQPVVALADGSVLAMEALARWNHPKRGLLAPDSFIPAAERSGAIVELGSVVLETACIQTAEWQRAGHAIDVTVNVSARQLADPEFVDRTSAALTSSGLDADSLWLEVTETSLVEEVDRAGEVLFRLAELGVNIAIDDFGTGWASLTYLRSFPVHALKIDRSFVAGVGRNLNDTAIVRSVLSLGGDLDLFVIAEGIETVAQQKALQKLGCTIGQGFLFARPSPASTASIGEQQSTLPTLTSRPRSPHARRVPSRPTVDSVRHLSTAQILAAETRQIDPRRSSASD